METPNLCPQSPRFGFSQRFLSSAICGTTADPAGTPALCGSGAGIGVAISTRNYCCSLPSTSIAVVLVVLVLADVG